MDYYILQIITLLGVSPSTAPNTVSPTKNKKERRKRACKISEEIIYHTVGANCERPRAFKERPYG